MYRASFAAFPDDDAVIVVLSNGQADVAKIGETLAEVFLGDDAPECERDLRRQRHDEFVDDADADQHLDGMPRER